MHSRPFNCTINNCDFSSIGFASIEDLSRHLRLYHSDLVIDDEYLSLAEIDLLGERSGGSDLVPLLFDMVSRGDYASVQTLLAHGLDINSINEDGEAALFVLSRPALSR